MSRARWPRLGALTPRRCAGLLAGLYEFPAVDLPPSSSLPPPQARTKLLDALLSSLLDLPRGTLSPSTTTSPSSASTAPRILSRTPLPPVTQVYSHLNRTYHPERLVLCSASPPALRPAPASDASSPPRKRKRKAAAPDDDADDDDDVHTEPLVQSLAGRATWVPAAEVPTANIGGAVAKVWGGRRAVVAGRGGGDAEGKGHSKGGKGKGKGGVEKGQGSLMGFFARKETAAVETGRSGKKALTGGQARAKEDASDEDDEVIVVDETETGIRAQGVVDGGKKAYKKRRIAPASDEED